MIKNFLSILFLLSIGSSLYAMENTIKLPSPEKLRTYLFERFLEEPKGDHFIDKISLDEDLGDKELSISDIVGIVEERVNGYINDQVAIVNRQERSCDYDAYICALVAQGKKMLVEIVLKCILRDYPEVIAKLTL